MVFISPTLRGPAYRGTPEGLGSYQDSSFSKTGNE